MGPPMGPPHGTLMGPPQNFWTPPWDPADWTPPKFVTEKIEIGSENTSSTRLPPLEIGPENSINYPPLELTNLIDYPPPRN